jgi:hypothetical protein
MKYFKWIIGIFAGAMIGFVYWYFVGCNSGSCVITSSPMNSTMYGSILGLLVVNLISDRSKGAENKLD